MANMVKEYGKKGKNVFYAMENRKNEKKYSTDAVKMARKMRK